LLEKTQGAIKNYNPETGNIGHTKHRTKTKQNKKTQHRKLKR